MLNHKEILKELDEICKNAIATVVNEKYNVELTKEESNDLLYKLQSEFLKGDFDVHKTTETFIENIKRSKNVYGRCTKKPIQVQYRAVKEGETFIATNEGNMHCTPERHFIIKGVDGEEYPIEKAIFYKTYEINHPCSNVS